MLTPPPPTLAIGVVFAAARVERHMRQGDDFAEFGKFGRGVRDCVGGDEMFLKLWLDCGFDLVDAMHFFFDLGGDSFMAMRMIVHVKAEFGVSFSIRYLFDFPTLADCAREVHREHDAQPQEPGEASQCQLKQDAQAPR